MAESKPKNQKKSSHEFSQISEFDRAMRHIMGVNKEKIAETEKKATAKKK